MITAVLTGDNHLGTYYNRLRPDRLHRRRLALQAGFRHAVDTALGQKAQLFLIAGDLFDRPDPRNADRLFVAGQLARLRSAECAVVSICGNHDSPRLVAYDGGTVPLEEMAALDGLCLLRGDDACGGWAEKTLTLTGTDGLTATVRVRGFDFRFGIPADVCPLKAWIDGLNGADTRQADLEIVLSHYAVEGWEMPQMVEPVLSRSNLDRLAADVIGVGHLHVRNLARLPGGALLLNPGATERIHFGEEKHDSGCYILTLAPSKTADARYVPHPHQPMKTVRFTGDAIETAVGEGEPGDALRHVLDTLETALSRFGDRASDALLRVEWSGSVTRAVYDELDPETVRQWLMERCCHAEVSSDLDVRGPGLDTLGDGTSTGGNTDADKEIEAVIHELLGQVRPEDATTDRDREDAKRQREVLARAKETLLGAYQRLYKA